MTDLTQFDIDWKEVAVAVTDEDPLDAVEVVDAIDRAYRSWLPYDHKRLDSVQGVEQLLESAKVPERREYKAYVDLWGWWDGRVQIIDWKTVRTLDDNWKLREERSTQGLWYAMLLVADGRVRLDKDTVFDVEFRGVKNPDASRLMTARQSFGMAELVEFQEELGRWEDWFTPLAEDWNWPWPKNKPDGCRPFGPRYPCAHEEECFGGAKNGFDLAEQPDKMLSYSTLKELKRCPERVRLNVVKGILDPTPREESEESKFGKAFHAGIAKVYQQVFEVGGEKNGI